MVCVLVGCRQRAAEPEPPKLTFETAKSALLELLRSKSCTELNPFNADKLAGIEVKPADQESVAYWGPFRLDLAEGSYELTVSVGEPPRVCTQFSRGKFEFNNGRWVAKPPATSWALGER
jgi:hypothetical protein